MVRSFSTKWKVLMLIHKINYAHRYYSLLLENRDKNIKVTIKKNIFLPNGLSTR